MSYLAHRRKWFDADALAFLDAASISDSTIRNATTQLVVNLKDAGLWTKMNAIYPFVGGTASTHKWNLKDPRDLDAAFRLSFSGGWTHSSTGALPNGTTGYGDTHVIPSSNLTLNNTGLSIYLRTDIEETLTDIGVDGSGNDRFRIYSAIAGSGNVVSDHYDFTTARVNTSTPSSLGLTSAIRESSIIHKIYKNGVQEGSTNTGASGNISTITNSVYVGARQLKDAGGASGFTSKEFALASIHDGLLSSEILSFYNIVQSFQTTLSRQV
jgi:hypothetical protein